MLRDCILVMFYTVVEPHQILWKLKPAAAPEGPMRSEYNVVLGDTKYQVSILPIPGSRIVVSSTETGIDRY